jgi:hypothetical protein
MERFATLCSVADDIVWTVRCISLTLPLLYNNILRDNTLRNNILRNNILRNNVPRQKPWTNTSMMRTRLQQKFGLKIYGRYLAGAYC